MYVIDQILVLKCLLMSRIERKYCLISTSYLAGSFGIFIFISDRIVCVLVTFYH